MYSCCPRTIDCTIHLAGLVREGQALLKLFISWVLVLDQLQFLRVLLWKLGLKFIMSIERHVDVGSDLGRSTSLEDLVSGLRPIVMEWLHDLFNGHGVVSTGPALED